MKVRIYKPAKNAMQSGLAKTENWIVEYETASKRQPEPLMGWTQAGDTLNQVRLKFKSREDAIAFAESRGWGYTVSRERQRRVKPRNYGDNFKYAPPAQQDD